MSQSLETNQKRRVLVLTGGGIRGAVTASYLHKLEESIGRPLHEVFDLVAGTSTGSFLAAGIAAGKPMSELAHLYDVGNAEAIFQRTTSSYIPILRSIVTKYAGDGKTEFLKKQFGEKTLKDCKTNLLIVAHSYTRRHPVFWNTFVRDHINVKIRELTDASSAAPTFFPRVPVYFESDDDDGVFDVDKDTSDFMSHGKAIPESGDYYFDGGIDANDACTAALALAKREFKCPIDNIEMLVVGTGYPIFVTEPRPSTPPRMFTVVDLYTVKGWDDFERGCNQSNVFACRTFLQDRFGPLPPGVPDNMDKHDPEHIAALHELGKLWWVTSPYIIT